MKEDDPPGKDVSIEHPAGNMALELGAGMQVGIERAALRCGDSSFSLLGCPASRVS